MMNENFLFLISGLFGGVLRGLVGIAKSKMIERGKFEPVYFGVTLGLSALVGLAAGIIADNTWQFSFLAGYAGTDFLEGLYKLRLKQFLLQKANFSLSVFPTFCFVIGGFAANNNFGWILSGWVDREFDREFSFC